jgi:hypothetical protein
MIRPTWLTRWKEQFFGRRTKKHHPIRRPSTLNVLELEDRSVPAVTSFAGGVLTIDFDAVNEAVTINNNLTNITLTSTNPITGAGSSFAN